MLLAADIGNTQIALGLADANGWLARWRLETDDRRTADEYGILVAEMFNLEDRDPSNVGAVVLACVVPSLTPVMTTMSQQLFGHTPLVVGPGTRTGMVVRYNPPSTLGSDRLVNAVAARHRFGAPVVVVDFGTATTFNVVDRDGAFAGGAIAPGVGIAADVLAEAGARLHRIDLSPPDRMPVVGRSTQHSMRSGVLYGYAGLVEGLLARIDAELDVSDREDVPVVATGGMAGVIAPLVDRIDAVENALTLEGLRLVGQLNGVHP